MASYLSTFVKFDLPYLHLAPLLEVTPFEFQKDFWHQKTRVPRLSREIVCVILRLAVLVELQLVTNTQRNRQTDRHRAMAYIAQISVVKQERRRKLPSQTLPTLRPCTDSAFILEK